MNGLRMNVAMVGRIVATAAAVFVIGCFAGSAIAASFDCKRASTKVEARICNDNELSHLDESLEKTYREVSKDPANGKQIRVRQHEWLTIRNRCIGRECLVASYISRLADLKRISKEGAGAALQAGDTVAICQKAITLVKTKNKLLEHYAKFEIPSNDDTVQEYMGIDLDGDGKADKVTVSSGSQESLLTVQLSLGGGYDYDGGIIGIVYFDNVPYALEAYRDSSPDLPVSESHSLSLLFRSGVIPICDVWSETQFQQDR